MDISNVARVDDTKEPIVSDDFYILTKALIELTNELKRLNGRLAKA